MEKMNAFGTENSNKDSAKKAIVKSLLSQQKRDLSADTLLDIFAQRVIESEICTDAARGEYLHKLAEIVSKHNLNIYPLKESDILALSAFCTGVHFQYYGKSVVKPIKYELLLMYQLLRSIGNKNIEEVEHLKIDIGGIVITKLMNSVMYEGSRLFAYNYVKKSIKMTLLKPKFEGTLELGKKSTFKWAVECALHHVSIEILGADERNLVYKDFLKNIFSNKIFAYTLSDTLSRILGSTMQQTLFNKGEDKPDIYQVFEAISEITKSLIAAIQCNCCIEGTVTEGYISYVEEMLRNLKLLNSGGVVMNQLPKVNTLEARELREEIKELRRLIYNTKKSKTQITSNIAEEIEEVEETEEVIEEELKASNLISLSDKLELIKEKKVLIITGLSLDPILSEYCNVIDATKFKGKSIDARYQYVIKITKGIDHAIGYDIDSEVKKCGCKLITTSRTNTSLILDDIIAQLE